MALRSTTFHLTKPICACDEQSIHWGLSNPVNNLWFECTLCGTKLTVPIGGWAASIQFDEPYPEPAPEDATPLPDNVHRLQP